jgi:hypothetical protein
MQNRQAPLPPPTTPLLSIRATQLCIGLRFGHKTIQNHVSPFNYAGRRRGRGNDVRITRQQQQPNCGAFSTFICCFTCPSRLLQLQPSLPSSTSTLVANFIPCRQLQPLSPFNFQTLSLFYFLPLSLVATMCFMQLLDDLVNQIIIHSIKDEPVFHFLNLRIKICGTF